MSLNIIHDYKLWDSLLGIENITWEFSTDSNFNNIVLSNTTNGDELKAILPLMKEDSTNIYCRVKINGYNGSTDWFNVIEDKSNHIYITKGMTEFDENMLDNKKIIKEIILNKLGNILYEFNFNENDDVLFLNKYHRILDIDFLGDIDIYKSWSFENIKNTNNGVYTDEIYESGNDYLNLPIINRNNIKYSSNLKHDTYIEMNNKIIEIRINLNKALNSNKYIEYKDIDGNVVLRLSNKNDSITVTVNDTDFILSINPTDTFYLIGFDTNGKIYVNHVLDLHTGLPLSDIYSIHIGNEYLNNDLEINEYLIDWIRVYEEII